MTSSILKARVQALRHEAEGILSIELRPAPDSAPFPAFEAGAHIDLHLPNGLVRNYSLMNPETSTRQYQIAVLNDRRSRGGSRYVHEQLRVGAILPISGPRNRFALDLDAEHSVLLAGGIGVTPLLGMLRTLAAAGKPTEFIYCARSRRAAAFIEDIRSCAAQAGIGLVCHFDDEQGAAPDFARLLQGRAAEAHFYCCGPGPMLDAFERTCAELGYAHAHIERFAAAEAASVPAQAETGGEGYEVELRRSARTLHVPAGKPLLDVLLEAGMSHDHSCREGLCGACETRVLGGEVEHRDSILTRSEREANNTMMVCVSGCRKGPLVLDL